MFDIVTEKQKDNVAKFLYDIAKIALATMVLAPITHKDPMGLWTLTSGICATIIFFLLAFNLDKKEIKP